MRKVPPKILKEGGFFISKIEVRFKINEKAHILLKKIANRQGVPMAYIMRNFLYGGLHRYLKNLEKGENTNEISKKTI